MKWIGIIILVLVILIVTGFVVYTNAQKVELAKQQYESNQAEQNNIWQQIQNSVNPSDGGSPCNPFGRWNQADANRGCYGKEYFNLGRYLNSFFGI